MKVGITGHQERGGIKWPWVGRVMRAELQDIGHVDRVLSCLAVGSDQLFAEVALDLAISVTAVIPCDDYARFFKGADLKRYQRLLAQCKPLQLSGHGKPEQAFYEAGKYIADESDFLFAVWDGEKAGGLGGTGDIVSYARYREKPVIHIEPIKMVVHRLG